jgi:Rubisco LSMT substrate-binding
MLTAVFFWLIGETAFSQIANPSQETMRIRINRIYYSAVTLFTWVSVDVLSWSFRSEGNTGSTSVENRSSRADALQRRLKEGESLFQPGIDVVSVGVGDECGIQLEDWKSQSLDEDVIFIDRSEFITPQFGFYTPVGQALDFYLSQPGNSEDFHHASLPRVYLAIYLALYKQDLLGADDLSSEMSCYLGTLPSRSGLNHMPIFWEDSMLEELQCSLMKQAVGSRRNEWQQEFRLIQIAMRAVSLPASFLELTLDSWFWARSIITSRGFTDSNDQPCLCPYVDMMNHITNSHSEGSTQVLQCQWYIDNDGYHLRLPDLDISEKTKMMDSVKLEISYGSHSNAHFLMNYGFSLADDDEEEEASTCTLPLVLPISVSEEATESLWEADGLGDCHTMPRNVMVGIGSAGPMESVLSLCRVASAEKQELSGMKNEFVKRDEHTTQSEDGLVPQLGATLCRTPFSISNEIRALHMLQDATQAALGRYSTTMEQDTDLLHSGHRKGMVLPRLRFFRAFMGRLFPPFVKEGRSNLQWENAVRIRRAEKKILNHYFLLASIGLSFLEMSKGEEGSFDAYKGMLEASLNDRNALLIT